MGRAIPFDPLVVAEDGEVVIVDKPPFLPTTSNGRIVDETVQALLAQRYGPEVTCIHRLDLLTSGLLIVSLNKATRGTYQVMFQQHRVHKTYRCLTEEADWFVGETRTVTVELANVPAERGVRVRMGGRIVHGPQDDVSGWREATTVVTYEGAGHWLLKPVTGRTHQLRATMTALGYPILGDDTYPIDRGLKLYNFDRVLHLVATELEYMDPLDGGARHWISTRDLYNPVGSPQ